MNDPVWVLHTTVLRELLEQAASGVDIDNLLIEAYANAQQDEETQ